ncbi:thioredoxin family protein [Ectobacillus panaciterrae]|uniref:thioredoxin family protein n=1 Tax=Ectobacillus panaciterrae TaxID=363872 RepID=UPI0024816DF6|nr:thioredoxin family protein [Ectobacillus panaciterrae]
MQDKKDMTVYFYQTSYTHCAKVSPVIVPTAKDMKIDMKVIDLEKYGIGWDAFKITGTPTIVRYKEGKEVDRSKWGRFINSCNLNTCIHELSLKCLH